jgi:hypothetical protein
MTLNFPNQNRSYDASRNRIRFWGHDNALEIAFFVEASALYKLDPQARNAEAPQARNAEAELLEAFDGARDRIHETARKVYSRARNGAYLLAAADF